MKGCPGRGKARDVRRLVNTGAALLLVLAGTARCGNSTGTRPPATATATLRVGVGLAPSQTPERGVQQFVGNISLEGLLRVDQEGRAKPWMANAWALSPDGLVLTIRLRRDVTFHDGSPVDPETIAAVLRESLPKALGSAFEDVESITAGNNEITIRLRRPSPFVAESLDMQIQKPGSAGIGTGPYMIAPNGIAKGSGEMRAYDHYYLGAPVVQNIAINTYPNVRAAWAEMLRDRLDMLYEVGIDALDSMQGANSVALYAFDRPYQYQVVLNSRSPKLQAPEVRRALNQAIDRAAIVRDALAGHGTASSGPVSPHHWAFQSGGSTFVTNPTAAAATLRKPLTLKCLTLAEPPFEHLALLVKRQLKAVNVDLEVQEATVDELGQAFRTQEFEAVLIDVASGWSVFRPYRWWHSKGTQNPGFSSAKVDAALDGIRHAANDDQYRRGVAAFEQAIADDPPAIFLAWGDRSRAISRRFAFEAESGRDVLSTLRLWKPAINGLVAASRN